MADRSFDTGSSKAKSFNKLVKKPLNDKKTVSISNEFNFGGNVPPTPFYPLKNQTNTNKKQGRPVKYSDLRFKATKPKKISPAVDNKLDRLLDYMTEFSDLTGRVTFDKQIDTLIDYYIDNKLGASKKEHLSEEIQNGFEKL